MDAEMRIDTQQHLFLYAYPAHQLQVGSRKGIDTRPSSVQEGLLRYRQDCEKEPAVQRKPSMDFARDMFMFSFCTRGMSFIDMAYLKKADLNNGCLAYRRKKTGQLMMIEWTKQMQDIIDKYKSDGTSYLLPIITSEDGSERRQYQNQMRKINRLLKDIANRAGLPMPLSMYYARHSWATIARGRDVPLAVISEGLGHDSETTTQIYLDSIKSSEVDKVNRMILEGL